MNILVTPRSVTVGGHPALARLEEAGYQIVFSTPGKQPAEEELCRLLPSCAGYLAGVEPVTSRVLQAAPNLRVISRNGTGVDNIDLQACERLDIAVCRAEGANARGVAELTLGLLLALARDIPFSDASLKSHEWKRRQGFEVEGRTLGLVGCGKIGRLVAQMALALGARVLAYDLYPDANFTPSAAFEHADLDFLMRESDIISLHCPPAPGGLPLLDRSAVSQMKRGVFLINTARADLMDSEAVLEGLESGQVAGLALDVFAQEPPLDYRLADHDRVIATPHVGGLTLESVSRAVGVAVENLLHELARSKNRPGAGQGL